MYFVEYKDPTSIVSGSGLSTVIGRWHIVTNFNSRESDKRVDENSDQSAHQ